MTLFVPTKVMYFHTLKVNQPLRGKTNETDWALRGDISSLSPAQCNCCPHSDRKDPKLPIARAMKTLKLARRHPGDFDGFATHL